MVFFLVETHETNGAAVEYRHAIVVFKATEASRSQSAVIAW